MVHKESRIFVIGSIGRPSFVQSRFVAPILELRSEAACVSNGYSHVGSYLLQNQIKGARPLQDRSGECRAVAVLPYEFLELSIDIGPMFKQKNTQLLDDP